METQLPWRSASASPTQRDFSEAGRAPSTTVWFEERGTNGVRLVADILDDRRRVDVRDRSIRLGAVGSGEHGCPDPRHHKTCKRQPPLATKAWGGTEKAERSRRQAYEKIVGKTDL